FAGTAATMGEARQPERLHLATLPAPPHARERGGTAERCHQISGTSAHTRERGSAVPPPPSTPHSRTLDSAALPAFPASGRAPNAAFHDSPGTPHARSSPNAAFHGSPGIPSVRPGPERCPLRLPARRTLSYTAESPKSPQNSAFAMDEAAQRSARVPIGALTRRRGHSSTTRPAQRSARAPARFAPIATTPPHPPNRPTVATRALRAHPLHTPPRGHAPAATLAVEASEFLVGSPVFKTGEAEHLGLAGSIPV